MDSRINRIARKLVIAAGNNVFDDYFTFYSDGAWVVQVVRKMISTVNNMILTPGLYNDNISKLDECINYLEDSDVDEMSVSSSLKEIKKYIKKIKDFYNDYIEDKKNNKYNASLNEFKQFLQAYERSCVNVFKNRYIEDEDNVNSLLQVIHEKGNEIFNNK